MKSLLLIFISCVYSYGFFGNSFLKLEETQDIIDDSEKIDFFYALRAKKQVEYLQAMTYLSLNSTQNDTINETNMISSRIIANISELYANTSDSSKAGILTPRERRVFNAIDQGIKNKSNINIFSSTLSLTCNNIINYPEAQAILMDESECLSIEGKVNGFYGASVFSLSIPQDDILNKFSSKIHFDDSLDNSGTLAKNSTYFINKYKKSMEKNIELSQKIFYLNYDQLTQYIEKYTSTLLDNSTFISKQNIMNAITKRLDVLISQSAENNLSVSDLNNLKTKVAAYSFNQYDAVISYDSYTNQSCINQKTIVQSNIDSISIEISQIETTIGDIEAQIVSLNGQLTLLTDPFLIQNIQNQLNTLLTQLQTSNNDLTDKQMQLTNLENLLNSLGC